MTGGRSHFVNEFQSPIEAWTTVISVAASRTHDDLKEAT